MTVAPLRWVICEGETGRVVDYHETKEQAEFEIKQWDNPADYYVREVEENDLT